MGTHTEGLWFGSKVAKIEFLAKKRWKARTIHEQNIQWSNVICCLWYVYCLSMTVIILAIIKDYRYYSRFSVVLSLIMNICWLSILLLTMGIRRLPLVLNIVNVITDYQHYCCSPSLLLIIHITAGYHAIAEYQYCRWLSLPLVITIIISECYYYIIINILNSRIEDYHYCRWLSQMLIAVITIANYHPFSGCQYQRWL